MTNNELQRDWLTHSHVTLTKVNDKPITHSS